MCLEAVVDAAMSDDDDESDLVRKFRACRGLRNGNEFRARVDDFCNSVVRSEDVSQEIEPLVGLLITYAVQNFQQGEGNNSSPRRGGGGQRTCTYQSKWKYRYSNGLIFFSFMR